MDECGDPREKILIYSALFHDVGKLNYGPNYPHEKSAFEFIDVCGFLSNQEKEEIKRLIRDHHITRGETELNDIRDKLLRTLIESDHLSAKMERIEKDTEENRYFQPLISPFSEISLLKKKNEILRYPIFIIENKFFRGDLKLIPKTKEEAIKESREIVKGDYLGKNLSEAYKEITKKLKQNLKRKELDVNSLMTSLKIYLQFIPSATYKDLADIPLYDHLKTTAAIALSMYRTDNNEKPFLLIGGDLSGIQNFIFYHFRPLESDKKSAKRLRGRSFFINILIDAAIHYIQRELKLYDFSVLWSSGGNFCILAPNLKENKRKLEEIDKIINKELYEKYGNLYLTISYAEGGKKDIENFSEFLDKLNRNIEEEKKRKYIYSPEILKTSIGITPKNICPICGRKEGVEKEGRSICRYCEELEEIGELLGKSERLNLIVNPKDKSNIKFDFGVSYKLSENIEEGEYIFGINYFSENLRSFKLYGIYTPRKLSFSQIVDKEKDLKKRKSPEERGTPTKLALLKADVDNLGLIFSVGFERFEEKENSRFKSISRLTFLSFLFNYFFSIKINKLAENKNIYVLFSGGDDLIVAGRFDEIIEFAEELNREFGEFVQNKEITISAGVELADYKFPIKRIVSYASERLKESKREKARITIFDETVTWKQFEEQIELSREIYRLISDNKVSAGFLFYLLRLRENCFKENVTEGEEIILNYEPYIRYIFSRNFGKSEEAEKIVELILKEDEKNNINNFKHINICVSLVSLLKRYKLLDYGKI